MNIHIIANHYLVASGRYAADALRRMGHTVSTEGPEHGRAIWGMRIANHTPWEPQPLEGRPDLVIVMDSDPAMLDLSRKYMRQAPVVVWGVDNHVRAYYRPWIARYYYAHRTVSVEPWDDERFCHLPCAYDDTAFTPSQVPWFDRRYDVAMIGVMYPDRWRIVDELKGRGLRVLAGTGLVYDAYREAYHNARISLCISAARDVAQRVFETAAMGCAVVSDQCGDYAILKPRGVLVYDDNPLAKQLMPLSTQIIRYLASPDLAARAIAASQAWAAPHTWQARANVILADWRHRD